MTVSQKNYLGIDVSKPWFDVSLLVVCDHQKQLMITDRFDNTATGMKAFKNGWHSTALVLMPTVYW